MTDEEINRKVAGIEGWRYRNDGQWWQRPGKSAGHDFYVSFLPPPYATDWAWCGPLVEKYGVDVFENLDDAEPGLWAADATDGALGYADTPQRAICLAVIAAHEGK